MIEFKCTTPMLKTGNIQATVDFYVEKLGFTVDTLRLRDRPALCILDRDDTHLMFSTDADWDNPGVDPAMTGQLVFDVSDVIGLHDSIQDKAEVLWGPEEYEYGRREFSVKDPNGYRLVFSELTHQPQKNKT